MEILYGVIHKCHWTCSNAMQNSELILLEWLSWVEPRLKTILYCTVIHSLITHDCLLIELNVFGQWTLSSTRRKIWCPPIAVIFSLIVDEIESDIDKTSNCVLRRVVFLVHCPFMKNNCKINRTFDCCNFGYTSPSFVRSEMWALGSSGYWYSLHI